MTPQKLLFHVSIKAALVDRLLPADNNAIAATVPLRDLRELLLSLHLYRPDTLTKGGVCVNASDTISKHEIPTNNL